MSEQNTIYNASVYTTSNTKFANLLCVPVEQYLNVDKVVLPIKDDKRDNIVECLEFICKNFANLKKLKLVILQEKIYANIWFKSFDNIITNKIALLQKLLFIRVCFANKRIAGQYFYGQSSGEAFYGKNNLTYSYMNDMIIFNSDDDLVIPANITKLNIVKGEKNLQKILNNFQLGLDLTDLTIAIDKNQMNLVNSLNLPSTITKINLFVCISEHKNMQIDKQAYSEYVEECINIKNEIEKMIKIPHNCELNIMIETVSNIEYTSESDDTDYNDFNNKQNKL